MRPCRCPRARLPGGPAQGRPATAFRAIDKLGVGGEQAAAAQHGDEAKDESDGSGRKPRRRRGRSRSEGRGEQRHERQEQQEQRPQPEEPAPVEKPAEPKIDLSKVELHEYEQPKAVGRRSATAKAAPAKKESADAGKAPMILGVGVPASAMKNE